VRDNIALSYPLRRESVAFQMTNEEMQKTMEFILEHQAQFAVSIQRLQEERVRDQPRLAHLEESFRLLQESFQLLVQLAQTSDSRFDSLEANQVRDQQRQTRLEESFQLLVQLAQTSDSRLDKLESNMVKLESNMAALAIAQVHTDQRLSALIDIVREDRNGKSPSS
jgi:chromosome segregation ATPase